VAQLDDEPADGIRQTPRMTVLRCTCGALVEGTGEALLAAVEEHLLTVHVARANGVAATARVDARPDAPPSALRREDGRLQP